MRFPARRSLPLLAAALLFPLAARSGAAEESDKGGGGATFETGLTFDAAVAKAKGAGKPLFVDFWSDG